jgi:CubicO group peptidase (beta-lactamase class C family)
MLTNLLLDSFVLASIPGVSMASLRGGEIASVHALGIRGAHDRAAVDVHTVFEAASLTKPVVSFIALQLVEEGLLDLGAPLQTVCAGRVEGDARAALITAAHVLTQGRRPRSCATRAAASRPGSNALLKCHRYRRRV